MSTTTESTPRVWIGCLNCYNAGLLVGDWYAAHEADLITVEVLHSNQSATRQGCEEMWVMDTDGLPVSREMSPQEAAEWGHLLSEVDERQGDALAAWVRSGDYVAEGLGDLPSMPDFEDRYCGEWGSFREFAQCLADDIGLLQDVPDEVTRYFDWDAWARDLAYDYTTEQAPGGVFVFRSL